MKKLLALSLLTGALAIGTTARALPLAADSPTEIFGSLIFADGWADNPDSPYGIYSFSDEDGSPFSLVKKGREYIANGGACYAGGKYFSIGYETGYYGEIGNIYYRVFDTKDDWKKIREVRLYGTNSIATDLTYNPKNDKIYGCFWINSASKEFSLATVDILTGKPTVIGTLSEQLVGLACRRDGVMFGIGISGNVFRLDITETGVTLVEVGHSNLNVRYAQSAAFDHATDRLLWSATMDDFVAGSALYEVNQTDGSVTYLNAYPDGYEMTGIYTAHEASYQDAPASVSGAYFNFTNDALSGSVNFTMPSTTYGGTATLSGALTYEVVIDDNTELFRTGSATAGTNASVSYSFTTPGWHAYRISAVKDGKRSPVTIGYRWIGVDKAKAVNPVMTKTGTGLSVSWSAPEKGVNGGYIPVNKLTYRVVRQPEGVQVYEGAATSFSENITITALDKYWYDVIALADGKVGETASSNKLRLGQAVTIPYSQDFYKEDAADFYTFIDANNDEITAFHYEDYLMYQYSEENAADDWIITPPLDLNASSVYEVKANVKANSQYFPECFSLHFGTEATAEAMTTELLPATRVDWSDYQEIKAQIRPKENLPGYVGFHIVSDAGADIFTVDDISVVRLASALAPDSVTNLRAVAAKDGSLKATLTFTLPSKALNGTSPANLTSVEIQREGMVIATLNDRHDGETVTYEDLTPPRV